MSEQQGAPTNLSPPSNRLSEEDRALIRLIGQQLRQIIAGSFTSHPVDRLDELGILANLVNRVARELHLSRERDRRQQQEIERQLAELRAAHATQELLLATIQEISTPSLSILEGVLLLPLMGALDSARAGHLLTSLLERVQQTRARVVILDVTAAHTIDTQVANSLLATAQAVSLLGCRTILCGINPETAQVVVSLGINLASLTTCSDLQAALSMALRLTDRRVTA